MNGDEEAKKTLESKYKVDRGKSITRLWFQSIFGLFIAFQFFWIFNSLFLGLLAAAFLFFIPFYKEKDITNTMIFAILMIAALYMAFNAPGASGLGLDMGGPLFAPWTWNTNAIIFITVWVISMLVGLTSPIESRKSVGVLMILVSFFIFATGPGLQETGSAFFGQWWPTVYSTSSEIFGPLGDIFSGIINTFSTGLRMITNPQEFAQDIISGVYVRDPETGIAGAYGVEIESLRTTPIYVEQPFNVIMKISNKGAYPAKNIKASISLGEGAPTQTESIKTEIFRSFTERVKAKAITYLEKDGTTEFESVLIDIAQDKEKGIESFSQYIESLKDDLIDKGTEAMDDLKKALDELDETKVKDYVKNKMSSVKSSLEEISQEVRNANPEIGNIINRLDKTEYTSTDVKNTLDNLKNLAKDESLPPDAKTTIENAIRTVRGCKIIVWLDKQRVETLVNDVKSKLSSVKIVSLKKDVNLDRYVENVKIYGEELENHLLDVKESTTVLYDELEIKFIVEELASDVKDIVYPPGIIKTPLETLELVKTVGLELAWEALTIGGTLKSIVHETKTILKIPVPWTKDVESKISEMETDTSTALNLANTIKQKADNIGDGTLKSNSKEIVGKLEDIKDVLESKKIQKKLDEIESLRRDIEDLKKDIEDLKKDREKAEERLRNLESKENDEIKGVGDAIDWLLVKGEILLTEAGLEDIDTKIEVKRETIVTKTTQIKELIDGTHDDPDSGINDIIDREIVERINGKGDNDIMGHIDKMQTKTEELKDEWVREKKDITSLVDLGKSLDELEGEVKGINEGILSILISEVKKGVSTMTEKVKSLLEGVTDPAETLWGRIKTGISNAYNDIKDDSLLDMVKKVDNIVEKISGFVNNVNDKLKTAGIDVSKLLDETTPDMIDELGFEEKEHYSCSGDICYQRIKEMPKSDIKQLIFESKGITCDGVKAYDLREKFIPFNGTVRYDYEIDSQLQIEVISTNEWNRLARENRLQTQAKKPSTFSNAPVKLNVDTLEQPFKEGIGFHIALQLIPANEKDSKIEEPVTVTMDVPKDFGQSVCTPSPNPEEGEEGYVWHGYNNVIICNFNGFQIGDAPSRTFIVSAHASYVFSKSKNAITELEFGGISCE